MSAPTLRMGHRDAVRLLVRLADGYPVPAYMRRGIEAAAPCCAGCGRRLAATDGAKNLLLDFCADCGAKV